MRLSLKTGRCALCFLFLLTACAERHTIPGGMSMIAAIRHCGEEYAIGGFSFLLMKDGRVIHQHYAADEGNKKIRTADSILRHFTAPLLQDRRTKDSGIALSGGDRLSRGDSLSGGDRLSDLFGDLGKVSGYMDETYPEYASAGDSIPDLFPGWYANGLSQLYGWYILKFQGRTILWNCFKEGTTTILVIKSMDKKVLLTASYTSGYLLSPFDLNRKNLLQSAIGLALIKVLYLPDAAGIDYEQQENILYGQLEKIQASYRFVCIEDLMAHAVLYERTGKKQQAAALRRAQEKLTGDSLFVRYAGTPALASVDYVSNDQKIAVPFRLEGPSLVQIFAGGQVRVPDDYENNAYQYDNVQLFVNDHVGEAAINVFDTHLFQFNYGAPRSRVTTADVAFGDPSDTSYIVETRISRRQLADKKLTAGRRLMANVLVGDCDLIENYRKSVISWTVRQNESFADFTKYGSIILTNKPGLPDPKKAYALPAGHPPVIDGQADTAWDRAPWSPILLPYLGTVAAADNSGKFKLLFDEDFLYVLFEITDNCRNRLGLVTVDKCWIEDSVSGNIVWKMNADTTGGLPSFTMDQKVHLPRGNYLLKYVSDKDNSYDHWYGKPPGNGVYGALLYIAKQ